MQGLSYLIKVIALAACYFLTARLGLLLAVPPGYATAMWPPSGVSLAALLLMGNRYWPGVLLGSLATNLFISFDPQNATTALGSVSIASLIALGAAMQALAGSLLIKRFVKLPNPLEHSRDVGLLLALGGPISCLINASVSITALTVAKLIPAERAIYNWLTWWVGDTIGVLIFTPVLLTLFMPVTSITTKRKLIVAIALLSVFTGTVALFFFAKHWEHERQRVAFEEVANNAVSNINLQLTQYIVMLKDIASLFSTSENISRRAFHNFTLEMLNQHEGVLGLSWSKHVKAETRTEFEAQIKNEGFSDFAIKQMNDLQVMTEAEQRSEYFPATYIAPFNPTIFGFDNFSEPQRRQAIEAARDSGEIAVTGRISVLHNVEDKTGFLIFVPLYQNNEPHETIDERRKAMSGVIAGAFTMHGVMNSSLQGSSTRDINFIIYDDQSPDNLSLLYESGKTAVSHTQAPTVHPDDLLFEKKIWLGNHSWTVKCIRSHLVQVSYQNWTVWFVLTGGLIFTGLFGAFALVMTAQTDVIRRMVEEKTALLARSEGYLRALLDNAGYAVISTDEDGTIRLFNQTAQQMLGYSAQEMVDLQSPELFHDPAEIIARAKQLSTELGREISPGFEVFAAKARLGKSDTQEWTYISRSGTRIPVLLTITAVHDNKGKIHSFLGIAADLSLQKSQEAQLKDNLRNVKKLQSRLQLAANTGRIAVWEWKVDTNELVWDKRMYEIYGYSEQTEPLTYEHWSSRLHPEDLAETERQVREALEQQTDFRNQFRICLPNGEIRHIGVACKGITDEFTQSVSVIGVNWDVTDLVQARITAEQAVKVKSEFLANMSHEIRTPMNGIIGITALALKTELTQRQREYLTLVQSSAQSLLHLLNDILDFSKMEAGKLNFSPVDFNLRERLTDAVRTMASEAQHKGLELLIRVAPTVGKIVHADPERLMQVILNLISNAIKFTEKGEVLVNVEQTAAGALHFSVKDTGIGIPKAAQARIFETFTQADNSTTRKFGGSGLGLSICAQIINLMHGEIWVESSEGNGSTFHFSIMLPVRNEIATTSNVIAMHAPDNFSRKKKLLSGKRALIVDDNLSGQNIIKELLAKWDLQIDTAPSTPQARAVLLQAEQSHQTYDLIVLDHALAQTNDVALLDEIKHRSGDNATLIILLIEGNTELADNGTNTLFLRKPISELELDRALNEMTALQPEKPQPPAPAQPEPQSSEATFNAPEAPFKPLRILLAEDHPTNQTLAIAILTQRGHQVTLAENGRQAVKLYQQAPFDLILMDVQMPEMDGVAATQAIRALENRNGQPIRIVALTAHALAGDRDRLLQAGMNGYLSKPFLPTQLLEVVEGRLESSFEVQSKHEDSISIEPSFNLNEALQRSMNQSALLKNMADAFIKSMPKIREELTHSFEQRDAQRFTQTAHRLHGAIANFAAYPSLRITSELETLGKLESFAQIRALLPKLFTEIERLISALKTLE